MQIYATPFGQVHMERSKLEVLGRELGFLPKSKWDYAVLSDSREEKVRYRMDFNLKESPRGGTTCLKYLVNSKALELVRKWIIDDLDGQKLSAMQISGLVLKEVDGDRYRQAKRQAMNSLSAEKPNNINI